MSGIAGALIVYGIDQVFDWLSSTGTEALASQEMNSEAQTLVIGHLETWLHLQFENSRQYEVCAADYQQIQKSFSVASFKMEVATLEATASIDARHSMIDSFETQLERKRKLVEVLKSI